MTGAYIDKEYVYAVARIRGAELKLLTKNALTELACLPTADAVFQALKEKGWGRETDRTPDQMLNSETEKLWELIGELVPDPDVFSVFNVQNDYHNLKAAIKASVSQHKFDGIYLSEARIDPEQLETIIRERNFGALPREMAEVAEQALDVYLRTGDGQLCDVIVDRACLEAILKAGDASNDTFLREYAELLVSIMNIKIAVRAALTGKDREFLDMALCDTPSLSKNALAAAASSGEDQVAAYLMTTSYASSVPALKKGITAFEIYCDDMITEKTKEQQRESFGLGPIAAYILARQNEIKSARIIFAGKENGFSDDVIMERVRETYV